MSIEERNKKCKRCGGCCQWKFFNLKMQCPFLIETKLCYLYRFRLRKYLMFPCWFGPFIGRDDCAVKPRKATDSWLNICWDVIVFFALVFLNLLAVVLICFVLYLLFIRYFT